MPTVVSSQPFRRLARPAATMVLLAGLAACGGGEEPSQQDLQAALSASNEVPPGDPTIQVEKLRCAQDANDKQAYLCKYRFPPADPIEGVFKKSAGVWRHVGPAGDSAQHS
jgi:hypothetical protein